jgi:hypothetical protein
MNEARFLALRRNADEAMQVSARARRLLSERSVDSFDGFGHFLDAILPDDPEKLEQIAALVNISPVHLERLRASRLDPLTLPDGPMVQLGQLAGIAEATFEQLIGQDHARFAEASQGVKSRLQDTPDTDRLSELRAAWREWSANEGSDL